MVIRAGLEPCITALKGLCPDLLDERTMLGSRLPMLDYSGYKNIIDRHMKECCKNDQIIDCRERSSILPLVNCLWRIETEDHLQVMNRKTGGLSQPADVGAGLRHVDGWNVH